MNFVLLQLPSGTRIWLGTLDVDSPRNAHKQPKWFDDPTPDLEGRKRHGKQFNVEELSWDKLHEIVRDRVQLPCARVHHSV